MSPRGTEYALTTPKRRSLGKKISSNGVGLIRRLRGKFLGPTLLDLSLQLEVSSERAQRSDHSLKTTRKRIP
jgi:hypothetical protein